MVAAVRSVGLVLAAIGLAEACAGDHFHKRDHHHHEEVDEAQLWTRDMARPRFGGVPYGVEITDCYAKGKVALTFDDGPSEFTSQILDTLDANGVKATFFIVGASGDAGIASGQWAGVAKRMHASGHQLGSHSFSHANFDEISYDQKVSEILRLEDAFAKVMGFIPTYWRPPYTACGGECMSVLNDFAYHVTNYNLDTKDYESGGVEAKDRYLGGMNGANPGSQSFVVLSHDIQAFTAQGFVQWMIDVAREKGFTFTTLGDCLGDPPANWYRDPKTGGPYGGAPPPEPPKPTPTPTPTPPPPPPPPPPTTTSTTSSTSSTSSSTSTTSSIPSSTLSTSKISSSTSRVTPPVGVGVVSPTLSPTTTTSSAPAAVSTNSAAGVATRGVPGGNSLWGLVAAMACIILR